MKKENGIKIASINGAEVLKIKAGLDGEIKYNTVFSNSLLLDKLKDIGLEISKQYSTKDIINVKFDYGYTPEETKDMLEELNDIKANNKSMKHDNKENINRIKQLNNLLKKNNEELKQYEKELETLNDEKEINKLQKKINTKENKIAKYKNELNEIDDKCINEINKNNDSIKDLQQQIEDNTYGKGTIRDILYKEGFSLDVYKTVKGEKEFDKIVEYVYWFRTGGKAKDGTDYFINKELFDEIDKWQRMGIELPYENCQLVEMEVYKSLISSAVSSYINIKPSEILVLKDLDIYSDLQDVIKVVRDSNTGHSKAIHTKDKCKNTVWDGMCLLQKNDTNLQEGFRGIRHHFYKTAGFVSDFQLYFKEYYKENYETATITDMFDREVKVSTIKMLTTNNAMKWIKFLGATKKGFEQWSECVEENGCNFGICKENHESKYGSKQRMSYQMLQTLDINENSLKEVFKDSLNYIYKLKNDDNFFVNHLKRTANTTNKNKLLVDLATTYPTFVNSYMFKDARKKEVNDYKETLKRGKLLTEGENETICPNPMLLLKYCTGEIDEYIHNGVITVNDNEKKLIDEMLPYKNSCCCLRFADGQKIGAFRSPHNSLNNILMFKNYINEEMDKYFKYFGKNVIVVNTLYNDVEDKGNGLDFDLDFLYCSTNTTVLEACEKAQEFPTIVNGFELAKDKNKYKNTMEDRAKVDNILQNSQKAIGTSSNVAMLYLTQYWHLVNEENHKEIDDYNYYFIEKPAFDMQLDEMLDNVCILSVLAQVAVDASKRSFTVGNGDNGLNQEINRIRKELVFKENPTFWQYTSSSFDSDEIEKKLKNKDKEYWKSLNKKQKSLEIKEEKQNMIENLYDYNCPFNNLLKEINKIEEANYGKRISDRAFIILHGNKKSRDGKQAKKIEGIVEELQKACSFLKATETDDDEVVNECYSLMYKEYLEKVNKYSVSLETMSLMIARALIVDNKFLKNNSKIKTKLLNILYKKDRDNFIKCFRDYEQI